MSGMETLADLVADRLNRCRQINRLALTRAEAADALGISVDHFERHIQPDLRLIRSGRLVLVPLADLEKWIAENAITTLEKTNGY